MGEALRPEIVRVALDRRGYDIVIGAGLLSRAGEYIRPALAQPRVVVVTDETLSGIHLRTLQLALGAAGIAHQEVVLPPGEQSKSLGTLEMLLDRILTLRPERDTTLIALGGGVIGDITGFAASILLRGIDFIQMPTTLLAMVDSSVGGKTGINARQGKNLIGTFHQPKLVLTDISALETLDKDQWLAGYAEVVKYGLIDDPDFFVWLEKLTDRHDVAVQRMVAHSCRAKARIVAEDEREKGRRALLNLGHTFGHALEAETGYALPHGHAVAVGMAMAFAFSADLGLCSGKDAARVRDHLKAVGLPVAPRDVLRSPEPEKLLAYMRQDKKVRQGRLVFILTRGIGKAFVAGDVEESAALAFLKRAVE